VEVDEHVVAAAGERREDGVYLGEGVATGAQEDVALEVDHAQAHAAALHDARAVAGLGGQEVRGAQDPVVIVEVADDLGAVVGVVAQRDDVDAGREQLVGDLRRDPEPARYVLAVDDHERVAVRLAQPWQQREQGAAAQTPDQVADEQQGRGGSGHVAYSRAEGR
jgi:hypothetical protein